MQQQHSQGALTLELPNLPTGQQSKWGSHRSLRTCSKSVVSRLTSTSSLKHLPIQSDKLNSKDPQLSSPTLVIRKISRRQYQDFKERQWRRSLSKNLKRASTQQLIPKDKAAKVGNVVNSRNKIALGAISSLRKNFQFKHSHILKFYCNVKKFDHSIVSTCLNFQEHPLTEAIQTVPKQQKYAPTVGLCGRRVETEVSRELRRFSYLYSSGPVHFMQY